MKITSNMLASFIFDELNADCWGVVKTEIFERLTGEFETSELDEDDFAMESVLDRICERINNIED